MTSQGGEAARNLDGQSEQAFPSDARYLATDNDATPSRIIHAASGKNMYSMAHELLARLDSFQIEASRTPGRESHVDSYADDSDHPKALANTVLNPAA